MTLAWHGDINNNEPYNALYILLGNPGAASVAENEWVYLLLSPALNLSSSRHWSANSGTYWDTLQITFSTAVSSITFGELPPEELQYMDMPEAWTFHFAIQNDGFTQQSALQLSPSPKGWQWL